MAESCKVTIPDKQKEHKITCTAFRCIDDFSPYTDSMLFDSHSVELAYAKFQRGDKNIIIDLDIQGHVGVIYKGCKYKQPSQFPPELVNLIKQNPNQWMNHADVEVCENNWFEFLFGAEQDGVSQGFIYEEDLSKATPQSIYEKMVDIAVWDFTEPS